MLIDLDDPLLGVTAAEVAAEWERGAGGKMTIRDNLMKRNLKIAIEHASDLATLRKALVRMMEFV